MIKDNFKKKTKNKKLRLPFDIIQKIVNDRPGSKPIKLKFAELNLIAEKSEKQGKRFLEDGHYYVKIKVEGKIHTVKWSSSRKKMYDNILEFREHVPLKQKMGLNFVEDRKRYRYEKIETNTNQTFYLKYRSKSHRRKIIDKLLEKYKFNDFKVLDLEARIRKKFLFITKNFIR